MILPTFKTEATDALCKDISKKSKGVCFLGFSHGKDSVCAFLQLKRYFKRIIPFHCASVPHMKYVDAILDYYEYQFQTKILRLMGEDLSIAMRELVYQEPHDANACYETFGNVEDYNKLDILEYLRKAYNLPRAWCAFGVNASDSIDRRIYCNKTGGKSDENRTFYPCWDWPRAEILNAIKFSGLKLAPEYKYAKRSIGGIPCATYNTVLKEHFPKDFENLKKWYPLAELKNKREERLDARYKAKIDEHLESIGALDKVEQRDSQLESTNTPTEEELYPRPDKGIYIVPDTDIESEEEE